ncbi:ABC transporter substrate binding protein [Maridesulfovibrio sp. FT414]|uniref:ABC transporter substrate binding protein n=1 Tax=Maridesulfovibrio sp. FT414 TaxID=2979469 RepID=UPI003D808619
MVTSVVCAQSRVLLLSSYHPGFPTFFKQIDGIKSALDPEGVLLDVEFMDSKRFYSPENLSKFQNLLEYKLQSVPPYDVIITSDDNALSFALQNRRVLFPDTPVVFCGVNNQDLARLLDSNDSYTGVIESASIADNIYLIPKLFPDIKKIFVIADSTPSGEADFDHFKDAAASFPDLDFKTLSLLHLSWDDLKNRLSAESSEYVVLLLSAYRDAEGVSMSFEESLAFIRKYSRGPIIHPYEHGLGSGVLGGKVISHYAQGQLAGKMAMDILHGTPIKQLKVIDGGEANRYIFDANQLKKYGITNSMLPEDSVLLNAEKSIFKIYKAEIVAFLVIVIALVVFSAVLLFYLVRLRRSEEQLRKSEARFSLAMDANKDGIWDWDIRTDEVYYSPGYKAMLGYAVDEVPAHVDSWLDLIHEEDREGAFRANSDCIENKSANFEVEFRMQAKSGEWRWILGRGNAVERDYRGRALRMIGTHTDITERKKSEGEIRRLRNYLRSIIDSMPFVLIGLDEQGRVSQWNCRAEEDVAIAAEQAVGRPLEEVFPRLAPQMERIWASLEQRKIFSDSRVSRRDGGTVRYDDITIYPLAYDGGEGVVVILEDVTERVRLEDMVIQNEKMLSIGGLAAGMAHEINNPLGAILQGAQNIQRRTLGQLPMNAKVATDNNLNIADVHAYLQDRDIPKIIDGISSAALRAARIVSNMLSFSRKSEDNFSRHDLTLLLDEVVDLAASDYDLATKYDFKRIDIVREYGDTPPVYCERGEIQQVFLNLLKNGAQSMNSKEYEGEKPRFTLRVLGSEDSVRVEIEDNGCGIALDVQKRIFEPFYTTKQVGEGTGLGLAVSYFIITDLHKGNMEVFSVPGKWTRFVITLPSGK